MIRTVVSYLSARIRGVSYGSVKRGWPLKNYPMLEISKFLHVKNIYIE